ncbi:hypothetical protein Tsubulata_027210, partial [Turnera subulata]
MATASAASTGTVTGDIQEYDRLRELKEFDATKMGVKGLVDAGIATIPRFFIHQNEAQPSHPKTARSGVEGSITIPIIDLSGVESSDKRPAIVEQVSSASREFGFFQISHWELWMQQLQLSRPSMSSPRMYHREPAVAYFSNLDLFLSKAANWRDTLQIRLGSQLPSIEEIPEICRLQVLEWDIQCRRVAELAMGLLCEGLGFREGKLKKLTCLEGRAMVGHYYPQCPQPNLTAGTSPHTDPSVLTVLLQDHIGGLQVKYGEDQWVDVNPVTGALVINIGELLQIISNNAYKSVEHRVLANSSDEPRVSIAIFFNPGEKENFYGPLPELVASDKPALYRKFTLAEFLGRFFAQDVTDVQDYDRLKELKEFDATKMGVKGLVDAGITTIPRIFINKTEAQPSDHRNAIAAAGGEASVTVPVIDLSGVESSSGDKRAAIVEQVSRASREFGFFQVVNHGVPLEALEGALAAIKAFHEQPAHVKAQFYHREYKPAVAFRSNLHLFLHKAANWRDTLQIRLGSQLPSIEEIPEICRLQVLEWDIQCRRVAELAMGLLCEGLGVEEGKLKEMTCLEGRVMVGHYYPHCPQPNLTSGTSSHTDPSVLTVLLQDHIGGLQVKYGGDQWVDVSPVTGAILINVGELLQIISNDAYKSVEHRVLANPSDEPRVSIAIFLNPNDREKLYGPLPELLASHNSAHYRQFTFTDFLGKFLAQELEGKPLSSYYKI